MYIPDILAWTFIERWICRCYRYHLHSWKLAFGWKASQLSHLRSDHVTSFVAVRFLVGGLCSHRGATDEQRTWPSEFSAFCWVGWVLGLMTVLCSFGRRRICGDHCPVPIACTSRKTTNRIGIGNRSPNGEDWNHSQVTLFKRGCMPPENGSRSTKRGANKISKGLLNRKVGKPTERLYLILFACFGWWLVYSWALLNIFQCVPSRKVGTAKRVGEL